MKKKKNVFKKELEKLHKFEKEQGIKTRLTMKEAIIEPLSIFSAFVLGGEILEKLK